MSGAVDGVALLPCPNPWCKSAVPPMPFTKRDSSVAVICGCDFHGPAMASRDEAIAAWNTRTTPPARSYADAIEDAAKVAEDLTFGTEIGEWLAMTKKEVSARACHECAAAIRLLSQGGKA